MWNGVPKLTQRSSNISRISTNPRDLVGHSNYKIHGQDVWAYSSVACRGVPSLETTLGLGYQYLFVC